MEKNIQHFYNNLTGGASRYPWPAQNHRGPSVSTLFRSVCRNKYMYDVSAVLVNTDGRRYLQPNTQPIVQPITPKTQDIQMEKNIQRFYNTIKMDPTVVDTHGLFLFVDTHGRVYLHANSVHPKRTAPWFGTDTASLQSSMRGNVQ